MIKQNAYDLDQEYRTRQEVRATRERTAQNANGRSDKKVNKLKAVLTLAINQIR